MPVVGRLLGRGSIYTIAAAAPMLAGVLVTPMLTRSMDVAEYGKVSTAIVVMQFTLGLLALGLPVAITRHALTEPSGDPGARGIATIGALLVAPVALIVAAGIALAGGFPEQAGGLALALALVSGGAGAGIAMAQAWAVAREDSWFYVALAFGISLLAPAAGLVAVYFLHAGALVYITAVAITYFVVEVIGFTRILRGGHTVWSRREFGRSLRIGVPLVPHQLAVNSAAGAAVLVAGIMLGLGSSGAAQIALYLSAVPVVITSAISYAWTPIVLGFPEEERGPHLADTAKAVTWLASLGGAALAVFAPWLLMVLAPASYNIAAMAPLVAIASLAASISAVYQANSLLIVASGKTGPFAIASPLALLAGAAVSVGLSRWLGLAGLGVGYIATYLLLAWFTHFWARRVSPVRWAERKVLAPLLVGAIGSALAVVLPWEDPWSATARIVLGLGLLARALQIFIREVWGGRTPPPAAPVDPEA